MHCALPSTLLCAPSSPTLAQRYLLTSTQNARHRSAHNAGQRKPTTLIHLMHGMLTNAGPTLLANALLTMLTKARLTKDSISVYMCAQCC